MEKPPLLLPRSVDSVVLASRLRIIESLTSDHVAVWPHTDPPPTRAECRAIWREREWVWCRGGRPRKRRMKTEIRS